MNTTTTRSLTILLGALMAGIGTSLAAPRVHGELKQWHKVTIDFEGPASSESATPNPFTDYRLDVRFTNGDEAFVVPGYYAADGDAGKSGADSGKVWRVHFAPNKTGEWTYAATFVTGDGVATGGKGKSAGHFDGATGAFEIGPTDKTGRDFRGKGRLSYVGKHHLQFEGTGGYFLKAGADAPENFLAYAGFDGDFKSDGHKDQFVKTWEPHVKDWRPGDPTWRDGKGKGIIGAVNYLADQGMNAFSFLTLNIIGDDRNVFPYTTYDERARMDCSRLDQWEVVFAHGTRRGMYLHFKTQEAENTRLLDDGDTGPERKLYYRELIARFGHHLALNWNLGEEVGYKVQISTEQKQGWAAFFEENDPYHHHMVIHNGNRHYDLLGDASALTGFSLQTNQTDFRHVHAMTKDYLRRSVEAGKPWVVACDEPGDAQHSLVPDDEDPTRDNARMNGLWGNLMAGGAGVEWYFGYAHAHSDLTCQDFRTRATMWKQCKVALDFFAEHAVPFWDMSNANGLLGTKDGYCLAQPGKQYLVFLKDGEATELDLTGAEGLFELQWFNPREGGALKAGSTVAVTAGGKVSLGGPPSDGGKDWAVLVRPGDPARDYPPGASAGAAQTVMLPRGGSSVRVELEGRASDDGKGGKALSSTWAKVSGPGKVAFADAGSPETSVTLHGAGTFVLKLTADDGKQKASSTVAIEVEPFQARVTRALKAVDSAYTEGAKGMSNGHLKVEGDRRVAYVKFDVKGLPPTVLDVQLRLTGAAEDAGSGTVRVFKGRSSDWAAGSLSQASAPKRGALLGKAEVRVAPGGQATVPVKGLLDGDGTYTVVVALDKGGNDIWFESTRAGKAGKGPELLVTFEDPDGKYGSFGNPGGGAAKAEGKMKLSATEDFKFVTEGGFVPGYLDQARRAMAINAAVHQGKFAAAECVYGGKPGTYDLVLTTLTETDGECTYRVFVGDRSLGEVKNPTTETDYGAVAHRFEGIELKRGDVLRVEFNSSSNGKIPEGDGFAFARGRWRSLEVAE